MEKFENLKEFLHFDEYFTEEKVVICNSRAEAEALKEKFLLDADFYFATEFISLKDLIFEVATGSCVKGSYILSETEKVLSFYEILMDCADQGYEFFKRDDIDIRLAREMSKLFFEIKRSNLEDDFQKVFESKRLNEVFNVFQKYEEKLGNIDKYDESDFLKNAIKNLNDYSSKKIFAVFADLTVNTAEKRFIDEFSEKNKVFKIKGKNFSLMKDFPKGLYGNNEDFYERKLLFESGEKIEFINCPSEIYEVLGTFTDLFKNKIHPYDVEICYTDSFYKNLIFEYADLFNLDISTFESTSGKDSLIWNFLTYFEEFITQNMNLSSFFKIFELDIFSAKSKSVFESLTDKLRKRDFSEGEENYSQDWKDDEKLSLSAEETEILSDFIDLTKDKVSLYEFSNKIKIFFDKYLNEERETEKRFSEKMSFNLFVKRSEKISVVIRDYKDLLEFELIRREKKDGILIRSIYDGMVLTRKYVYVLGMTAENFPKAQTDFSLFTFKEVNEIFKNKVFYDFEKINMYKGLFVLDSFAGEKLKFSFPVHKVLDGSENVENIIYRILLKETAKEAKDFNCLEKHEKVEDFGEIENAKVNYGVSFEKAYEILKNKAMSATAFELLIKCPKAFLLKYVFKIEEEKEDAVDFDNWLNPLLKGIFLHKVMEDFVKKSQKDGNYSFEEFKILIEDEFEKCESKYKPKSIISYIKFKEKYIRILGEYVKKLINEMKNQEYYSFEILGSEIEFGNGTKTAPDASISLLGDEFKVRGKIDRLDKIIHKDGRIEIRVIDYKSGNVDNFKEKYNKNISVQDSIYKKVICENPNDFGISGDFEITSRYDFFDVYLTEVKGASEENFQILEEILKLVKEYGFLCSTDLKGLDLEEFPQIKEFYEKSIKLKKSSDCSCGKVCKGDGNGKF